MKAQFIRIAGAAMILVLGGTAWAQERKVAEFTGTGVAVAMPYRGVIRCIGTGNPTPADQDMPPWCPAGTQTSATNRIQLGKWQTSDPNTSGDMTWFHNFTVETATFVGPWWGNFMLNVPGKGTWQGWYWGESGPGGAWALRLIGIGTGAFDGSTLMAQAVLADPTKPTAVTGQYLQPK